uniref:hypothetical protein n=1 Tax=Helicobacter pylori TaxID=210 RepID=UPI002159D390|nr:hypothetical protein [Helicobacter pylori]
MKKIRLNYLKNEPRKEKSTRAIIITTKKKRIQTRCKLPPNNSNDGVTEPLKVTTHYLEIKNYKNIGVQNEQEKDERLYLNNSFNGDKLGGLVIILGENNTGKSNLLKALGCFSEHVNEFKKNCTPNYLGFKDAITQLGLCAEEKSGKYQNNVFKANIEIKNDEVLYSLTPTTEQLKSVCFALLNSLGGLEANTKTDFINKLNRTNNEDSLLKLFNEIDQLLSNEKVVIKVKKQFQKDLSDCKTKLKQELEQITNKWNGYLRLDITKIGEIIDNIVNKETTLEYMQSYLEQFRELVKGCVDRYNRNNWNHINYPNFPTIDLEEPILKNPVLKDYPLEKYADVKHFLHSKLGQVFYYKPTKSFEAEDLMTTSDDLTQSEFFELLFNAIDQNAFKEIKEAYNAYTEKKQRGYLNQAERKYEKLINEKVSKHFNQMYFQNKNEDFYYEFDFKLDSQEISLSLFKRSKEEKEEVLVLDHQSEGFRWYFDLFFNLLCSSHLKPNSIVIIDEGFSKLSAPTCIECHNFLKKLGQDKGITFVISTHNLYFANLDYLDELKFLKVNKDLRSVSVNQFTSRDLNDSTPSKVIKKLICANHKTLNENDRLLFVEGISDYNYLSAFKLLYEQEKKTSLDMAFLNIVFLPVNGLGNDDLEESKKPQMKQILETLVQEEPNTTLLVDGDTRGDACEELNKELKNKLNILKLNDCDDSFKNFKNIEDCFSQKDKIKLDLKNKSFRSHRLYKHFKK